MKMSLTFFNVKIVRPTHGFFFSIFPQIFKGWLYIYIFFYKTSKPNQGQRAIT